MGAPTLAGLAAAISIAMRRIEVRELSFRLFNGDQRPVTMLRSAVTENAEKHRMRGAHTKRLGSKALVGAPSRSRLRPDRVARKTLYASPISSAWDQTLPGMRLLAAFFAEG